MNDFIQEFAAMLDGFPVIILNLFAPLAGAIAAALVAMLIGEANTGREILSQLVVGYLSGAFCGPVAGLVVKFPSYTTGFIAGGSGYWFMKEYLKKKQKELMNKPPDDGPNV